MYATRQQPRWVPPLPPGWEAKFDPNQNTYFFINHRTKTTQWEDPRFSSEAGPLPTMSAAATSLSHSGSSSSGRPRQQESVQLQEFRSKNLSRPGARPHQQARAESSLSSQANAQLVAKLQTEFPGATRELIADMLSTSHNSEHKTRQQLKDLGFGHSSSTSSSSGATGSSLSASASHRGASPNRATSPAKEQTRAKSPSRASSPPRELSEAEKTKVINQLKKEFSKVDADIIRIATGTCSFSLQQSRVLIKAWMQKQTSGPDKNNQTQVSTSGTSSSSSSQPAPVSQQSLLPTSLVDDAPRSGSANSRRTFMGDGASRPAGRSVLSPTRHNASNRPAQSPSRGAHGDGRAGTQPQHARAQQVTRPRANLTRQGAVETSQPMATSGGSRVEAGNRTAAAGPNRDLRKGPDGSLLMSEYTQAQGPNSENREGPDTSRAAGPQGCQGPDVTLRCGPQVSHVAGSPLRGEASTSATRGGVLVSSC